MYFLQAKRSITLEAELANVRLVQRTSSDAFDRVDIELDEDSSASSPEVLSCVLTASTFNLSEDCAGLAKKRPSSTSRTLKPAAHTAYWFIEVKCFPDNCSISDQISKLRICCVQEETRDVRTVLDARIPDAVQWL